MKVYYAKNKFFKQSIKNSKVLNKKLLEFFNKENFVSKENNYGVSKTDWTESGNNNREWVKYFMNEITPYLNKIHDNLNSKGVLTKCLIPDIWYQQYFTNDEHTWHNHGLSNWINIYYVELPDNICDTEFADFKFPSNIKIKEGDLLTLPGHVLHRAPKVSAERRTVISFNSNWVTG